MERLGGVSKLRGDERRAKQRAALCPVRPHLVQVTGEEEESAARGRCGEGVSPR